MANTQQNLSWSLKSQEQVARSSSNLVQTSSTIPVPGPHEALLRVHAVSLNYRDVMIAKNDPEYPLKHNPGLVPCADGAGVIESAGDGSKWAGKIGARVAVAPNGWTTFDVRDFNMELVLGAGAAKGTLTKYLTLPDDWLVQVPDNLSLEEASCFFGAGTTAMNALLYGPEAGKPMKGRTVLTQGTGGVSCFAIQIASALGATVISTSSTDERLELCKRLGATHLINYKKTPVWSEEVIRLTDGNGVDHVVDVAGAGTIQESLRSARTGGLVSIIGLLSGSQDIKDPIPDILFRARMIRGVMGSGSTPMFEKTFQIFSENDLHPIIAKEFDFDDAPKAFDAMENGNAVGKLVIKIN